VGLLTPQTTTVPAPGRPPSLGAMAANRREATADGYESARSTWRVSYASKMSPSLTSW